MNKEQLFKQTIDNVTNLFLNRPSDVFGQTFNLVTKAKKELREIIESDKEYENVCNTLDAEINAIKRSHS